MCGHCAIKTSCKFQNSKVVKKLIVQKQLLLKAAENQCLLHHCLFSLAHHFAHVVGGDKYTTTQETIQKLFIIDNITLFLMDFQMTLVMFVCLNENKRC